MTTPSEETPAAAPSTELEVRVNWLRNELENVRAEAQRAVQTRQVGPLDEWVNVLKDYDQLGQTLARTEFVPKEFRGKPEPIVAAMMYGREVGLPPLTTLQNTYVVHGRVGMYAEQLRAMVLAAGHELVVEESNSDRCTVAGKRKGSDRWQTFTYTMDQAKLSGSFAQNDQYKKRPVEMLLARASAMLCHAVYPDVIRGMQALEEIEVDSGDAPPTAPPVEPAKKTVQRAAKKSPAKEITPGDDKAAEVFIPGAAKAGLPPLPGEEAPPVAPTDPPARRTEAEIAKQGMKAQYTEESAELAGVVSEGSAAVNPGEGTGSAPDVPSPAADTETAQIPSYRHCPDYANSHALHVWTDDADGFYECPGVVQQDAQGERSGPVADKPRGITPADTRLLQARFKKLGYTDEPDDREARLMVATVLAGVEVETFSSGRPNSITRDQAQAILLGLAECANRDDVLGLMVKRAQDARAEETGQ